MLQINFDNRQYINFRKRRDADLTPKIMESTLCCISLKDVFFRMELHSFSEFAGYLEIGLLSDCKLCTKKLYNICKNFIAIINNN